MSQQLEEQILKQNVLEEHRQVHELQVRIKELRADVERYVAINAQLLEDLEKAKTQLAKLRGQEPVFYYTPQAYCMNTAVVSRTPWESGMENIPLYAAANPAAVLELIAEVEALRANATGLEHQLRESRQNDYHAMSYLADCRFAVGDDGSSDMPGFVEYLKLLKQQRDELLAALKYARELVDDWGAYASAYIQETHDLAGDLDRLDAAIAKAESKT